MSNKALFPLRRYRGYNYNIFYTEDGQYAGLVFDYNHRPYYQTLTCPDRARAVIASRRVIELLAKKQCVAVGFKLDEGKAIREKEEQAQTAAAKPAGREETMKLSPTQQTIINRMIEGEPLVYRHCQSAHRNCTREYILGKNYITPSTVEALIKKGCIEADYTHFAERANFSGITTITPYVLVHKEVKK